jgi:CubicO group peptidase (beta-lactamase class C family)
MKKLLLLLTLSLPLTLFTQTLYFPPTVGSTWDTLSLASQGWCQTKVDSLYDYLEVSNSKAFILLKDGKIVLEKYFGTFTQDSLWYWASAGKTLTGFTVGIAQQEGHLSIEDTTSDHIGVGWTSATPQQEEKITIRHQLTMTSGLDELAAGDPNCTLPSCLPYLADAGTRWAYHTGVYTLLDSVIESATGMTLNGYINQKIKIPTGMTGAFFPSGYNNLFVSKPRRQGSASYF